MRIIIEEIKKIFNLKIVIILFLGSLTLYGIFFKEYVEYFPMGRGEFAAADIKGMSEMHRRYGNTLSDIEFKDFQDNFLKEKEKLADKYILNNEEAKALGVKSYKELMNYKEVELTNPKYADELIKLAWDINDVEEIKELRALSVIPVERWNSKGMYDKNYEGKKLDRYKEISSREPGIIERSIIENYDGYIYELSGIVIFGVILSLGAIFIKDRKNNVDYLQYTSKTGRSIVNKKLLAGIISIIMLTTIILGIGHLIYFMKCGTTEFFNVDINGVFGGFYLIDVTYLQYIMVKVAVVYLMAISIGLLIMWISSISKNYLKILCISVVVFLGIKLLAKGELLYWLLHLDFNEKIGIGILSGMIILGSICGLTIKRKGMKKDILY